MRALAWASEAQNYLGGKVEDIPEVYTAASPLEQVSEGEPPFLFIHGDQDVYVPADHSQRMQARLRERNNRADLVLIHGGGHVMNPSASSAHLAWSDFITDSPEAAFAIREFLARELAVR